MKKIAIAIDGPAAAGKSTIAKRVANNLGYTYIDTGAMYRCVAYYALVKGVDFHDENAVCRLLPEIKIKLMPDNAVYLNDRDVTADIRVNEISAGASIVSAYSKVRTYLVAQQREMAKEGGVILDGRDITFRFPRSSCAPTFSFMTVSRPLTSTKPLSRLPQT